MKSEEYKKEYGFDQVTWENLKEPAEAMNYFAASGAIGSVVPPPLQYWVESIQKQTLHSEVPRDIRILFETAKGCITYGVLFYPLFTVGSEQLFRLYETAVRLRSIQAGRKLRFQYGSALNYLILARVISEDRRYRWEAVRKLRNSTAHPAAQMILPPAQAVHFLQETASDINSLY